MTPPVAVVPSSSLRVERRLTDVEPERKSRLSTTVDDSGGEPVRSTMDEEEKGSLRGSGDVGRGGKAAADDDNWNVVAASAKRDSEEKERPGGRAWEVEEEE